MVSFKKCLIPIAGFCLSLLVGSVVTHAMDVQGNENRELLLSSVADNLYQNRGTIFWGATIATLGTYAYKRYQSPYAQEQAGQLVALDEKYSSVSTSISELTRELVKLDMSKCEVKMQLRWSQDKEADAVGSEHLTLQEKLKALRTKETTLKTEKKALEKQQKALFDQLQLIAKQG